MAVNYNQNQDGYQLEWDSTITKSDEEYVIFPEGKYPFEVVNFERGQHNGSEKLPPCKKVTVQLRFRDNAGRTTIVRENLFLYSTQMNKLCRFFEAIGQGPDEQGNIRMNWNAVIGSTGSATLGIRTYNGNKYNEIKRFEKPDTNATPGYGAPQQGYQSAANANPAPAFGGFGSHQAQPGTYPMVNTPTPWDGGGQPQQSQPQQTTFQGYTVGKF